MASDNVQIRISIINVPNDISPLKLNSYLRHEAEDIQEKASNNGLAMIRLFLPERILFALTRRKLDVILQKIANKYSCISHIEMIPVQSELSVEQMQEAMKEAEANLAEMSNLEAGQFWSDDGTGFRVH